MTDLSQVVIAEGQKALESENKKFRGNLGLHDNSPPLSPFSNILGKYSKDLLCLIDELKSGNISDLSLNLLIKVSYILAQANVKKKISRINNSNKRWGLSIEDITVESICNLFVKNSKRNMLNLECFALNWTESISNNFDALYFLNKIICISIDQYMNKLFRNTDPLFAKTLDTFYLAIKKLNYSKLIHLGTVYVVKDKPGNGPQASRFIPQEEFLKIPLNKNKNKIDLMSSLMDYIAGRGEYFPAIPLNLLVERYIEQNKLYYNAAAQTSFVFERFSVDDIIFSSLENTIEKMKKTYLSTRKITDAEADQLASALTDIAFDLREGSTIEQLPDYLVVYIKDLTIEEYRKRYRNIFEYLVKVFKKFIAFKLKQ